MMGSENLKIGAFCSSKIWVLLLLVLSFWMNNMVESQGLNSGAVQLMTDFVNKKLVNITSVISQEISNEYKFCIIDPNDDWNHAFNFSSDLNFLVSCTEKYREDVTRRFCSVAEVKNYFGNLYGGKSNSNRNCNLTKWSSGCEPGWACAVPANQNFDLQDSKEIPPRTDDCNPCCEGFFCPRGLTCMIPCPLGSYCPLATLNQSTGTCQPYGYQLPTGLSNHTCGGADLWADVSKSPHMFCSKGSYCPTTTQSNPCDSGHYCRMGSTTEKRCFRLTDCNPNTETQNIHAYGVMLIAATITLLLIIYNCSDQVIAARERRLTKTREAAARSAKEMVKARQKWKVVRDAAKKHASGLQAHFSQSFSRSFSRKKVSKDPEELTILDRSEAETEYDLYPHDHLETVYSGTSTESLPSSETSKGREIKSDAFKKMAFDIENASHNHEASDVDIGVAKVDGHPHKGKEISTHSQIFKYAYAQLEKEKAMLKENKNITFSGLVSMAANQEIRKRPPIEVSFKDLNVILKSKDKHLLRHVTGKFKPGRITAIMGPSGAGKTTFISALAGKAAGYRMTGSILINGRNDSIHSYRKTIGYVPQDDIVHGNLTVEENLWFNANCRLPAGLSKVDKVLIVERVIEYLGLQLVRDSLVGTVEKRGISGGQRKRVNVGLEMVMEPSLLILDEPTSGLDSASSQLLLRALRHEALEGVNICMVVHQPSYALFQMFDDLVLLAKGGVTVYHGSAKKAEAYFAGLGIIVPDRVNPPDYYIDILEGMVEPSASSKVNYKELPVRWMLHKGYPVPEDMQQSAAILATPAARLDSEHGTASPSAEDRTFAGDLWQDVREKVEFHQDKIRHNFSKFHDLSHRRTPGIILQYRYFLVRVLKQRMREAKSQAVDYLILFLAGACLGSLASYSDSNFGFVSYSHTIIAVSLLCKIAALRTFSQEKLQYWRESSSGMSSLAYFLAKDTVDHFNTVIKPVVYLSMFYFFINPRSPLTDNYVVLLCLVYCVTGIAYVLAIFFQPGSAQLLSVLLPIVLTLIATQNPTGENKIMKNITRLCYPKWALEAFIIANAKRYYGVWLITRCGALKKGGYDVHDWTLCIAFLMIVGLASRGVAFLGMVTMKKK